MTLSNKKFVASLTEVDKNIDILVEDVVSMGVKAIGYFVDEAIERGDDAQVLVVSDDMTMAENVAAALNAQYEKEMELMNTAKVGVKNETTNTKGAVIKMPTKKLNLKSAVKAAAESQEEIIVAASTVAVENQNEVKEEVEMKGTKNEEVKVTARRRLSSTAKKEVSEKQPAAPARRRLARSESIKDEFKKFEGPWYLNRTLYPVLDRLEQILDTMSDAELGIDQIVLVEPEEISRYRNRLDVIVVIQIKSNGNVLEFPIKNASTNSSSDLNSTSIGWVDTKHGMRPAFGFYRPNELNVKVTCTCGHEFKANTGNLYCPKCKKNHGETDIALTHDLDMELDGEWVFQTIPNIVVPRETLALIMAIAQYDQELDMHGVIEE